MLMGLILQFFLIVKYTIFNDWRNSASNFVCLCYVSIETTSKHQSDLDRSPWSIITAKNIFIVFIFRVNT